MVILWYNYHPNGMGDQNALHGGCPPEEGLEKWSGNKWIRLKPRSPPADWLPDHPALKRYGWREPQAEVARDPAACTLQVVSSSKEPGELKWVNPSSGERVFQGSLTDGSTISINSYKGHKFVAVVNGQETNSFTCEGDFSSFVLNSERRVVESSRVDL
eukprot:TRINITY_DN16865_c0_g1_i3.p1 TRINITY_DN16865_c0_g1~~TRINITY_DN16865_c0_g1_i3.p1  ORF type:complete len:159 (+),score=26.63 TRINITY_DN16865_c0_g1_i3:244-720(+)